MLDPNGLGGFTVLDKSYKQYNSGNLISGNIINPEIRHSGKLFNGKFGYKVSGSYFQGQDYTNYDVRLHHTNVDTAEYVKPADLKQSAVILASFIYHAAQRAERIPR